MIIGFTGTRDGVTEPQFDALSSLLAKYQPEEVHHGDCVGADVSFHSAAMCETEARIVTHPPKVESMRAVCVGTRTTILPAKDYLERNKDIVNSSDLLIACPKGPEERRSGTWSTVRYARKVGKPVVVVWPDGRVEE